MSQSVPPRYLSPSEDVVEDSGNYCYVTGNGGPVFEAEVIDFTRLTSPIIDMSAWQKPMLSFYYWYTSFIGPFISSPSNGGGSFEFKIFNGTDTVLVERWDLENTPDFPEWLFAEYTIFDYINPTSQMQFIFEIQGGPFENSYDEAAIDFFRAWDAEANNPPVEDCISAKVYPNPYRESFILEYQIASLDDAEIRIFDVLGKELLYTEPGAVIGQLQFGEDLMAGLYFLQVKCGGDRKGFVLVKQ
jgi:hypothetical protein